MHAPIARERLVHCNLTNASCATQSGDQLTQLEEALSLAEEHLERSALVDQMEGDLSNLRSELERKDLEMRDLQKSLSQAAQDRATGDASAEGTVAKLEQALAAAQNKVRSSSNCKQNFPVVCDCF